MLVIVLVLLVVTLGATGYSDRILSAQVGEELRALRTSLAESANVLLVYDLPRLIGGAVQLAIASRQLPLPIDPQAIENLNLPPGYTGIAVTAGKDEVRLRGIMPAEQVRGLVELFGVLQQAAPRRNRAN